MCRLASPWRDLVKGDDRVRALRALEASAITGLRKGLRRGSVWINHSLSFRERDQMLIPPRNGKAIATAICRRSRCRELQNRFLNG